VEVDTLLQNAIDNFSCESTECAKFYKKVSLGKETLLLI